jgi:hypothetical protein
MTVDILLHLYLVCAMEILRESKQTKTSCGLPKGQFEKLIQKTDRTLLKRRKDITVKTGDICSIRDNSIKFVVPDEQTNPEVSCKTVELLLHQPIDVPKSQCEGHVIDPPGKCNASQPVITRSGRISRKPAKLEIMSVKVLTIICVLTLFVTIHHS